MKGSVFTPLIPGEPIGMPGSVMPLMSGRSFNNRLTRIDRHVAAYDVAIDKREMTAVEILWDAGFATHRDEFMRRLDRDREAVFAKVSGISLTAAALRIFVEGCRLRGIAGISGIDWK